MKLTLFSKMVNNSNKINYLKNNNEIKKTIS